MGAPVVGVVGEHHIPWSQGAAIAAIDHCLWDISAKALGVPVYRLLFSSFYSAQRIDSANADHKVITRAIVEGRSEDAESAMRNHILDGFTAISELNAQLHL
jgi:L-alanine-DL-glutamate epimerase-like enolase superfamily enzyme